MLIILFQCYFDMKQFKDCISFLTLVKERQPLILTSCLTDEDLAVLMNRQTGAVLASQTVMYELLILNEDQEGPDSEPDEFY